MQGTFTMELLINRSFTMASHTGEPFYLYARYHNARQTGNQYQVKTRVTDVTDESQPAVLQYR